jgi:hypothetical protein
MTDTKPKIDWKRDTLSQRPSARLKRAAAWHERVKEEERQNDG